MPPWPTPTGIAWEWRWWILTINTPAEVWMAISRGEMNGATVLLAGKYSIQGNLGLLMRFNQLFSAAG
jgi:putative sterol carrier protein